MLDGRLEHLHNGRTIRTVLDIEQGAIFCYDLGPAGFLLGVTLDQMNVDSADWKMSRLANEISIARGTQIDENFIRRCKVCGAASHATAGHE